jgi:iron complex outermembrane receptor protein
MRRLLLMWASWAAIFVASAPGAQTLGTPTGSSNPGAATSDIGEELGEIVVTAQRREESLQQVPVSVTALTSETLKSRDLNDLSQIALAAPSLQIGLLGNFSIRGVGTLALANSVDSSVATAVDEVSLGRPTLAIDLFNDVQRVEVLNGPQGLLFGRNASAGLLNVITNQPSPGKLQNIVSFEGDSLPKPGVDGRATSIIARETINIPVSDTSALRLNGFYSYAEPPVSIIGHHTFDPDSVRTLGISSAEQDSNLQQYGIRGKYLNELTDRLSLYVIGEYAEANGGAATTTFRAVGAGPSVIAPHLVTDGIVPGPNNFLLSGDGAYFRNLKNEGAQAKLSYDLGDGFELSDIAAWKRDNYDNQLDTDFVSADGLDINHNVVRYDQYTNELRLTLPAGNRLSGQIGIYYFGAHTDNQSLVGGGLFLPASAQALFPFCAGPTPTAGCAIQSLLVVGTDDSYRLTNRSYAAFWQLTYDVTSQLKVIAGGRETRDELSIEQIQNQNNYFHPLGIRASFDQGDTNTNFSWKGGLQYQFDPTLMAYGTYGLGYKGPGTNETGPTTTSSLIVKPETSDNVEVGIKSSFFENRLLFDVSAFHTKFKNYQSESFDAAIAGFVIQNAASLTSQGAEITVLANPFRGFSLNGSAAFLDSKFDSFPGAQCYPGQLTPGCSTTGSFNASGFRTPTAPAFTSSVQAVFDRPVRHRVNAFIEANYYHRSSINYQINDAPGTQAGPIDILGGSLGLRFDNGARFSVFCKNCTDKRYPVYIGSDPVDATVNVASYIQSFGPDSVRTIGIAGSYEL